MTHRAVTLNSEMVPSRFAVVPLPVRVRLARGVAWTTLGGVVAQGGSLLCSVIVARLAGKDAFGQFAMILSTAVAITSMAGMGLGVTATKYVSEYRTTDPSRVGRILGLSSIVAALTAGVVALALLVFAPALSPGGGQRELSAWGLRWSAAYVYFVTINGYQVGAMAGFEAFDAVAVIGASYGAASVILTWLLTTGYGLTGAVLAQGVGAVLLWVLYHFALRRECRARGIEVNCRGAWQERWTLVRFSIPSAACGIVAAYAGWLCNSRLVNAKGYSELAVFSAVYSLRSIVLFVPGLIGRVSLPLLNNLFASGQWTAYRRTFRTTVCINGGVGLVLAVFLVLAGPALLRVFGRNFSGSFWLFAMVLGSAVLEVVGGTLFQALFTSGRIWRNFAISAVWATVLIACTGVAPRFGAEGLAFAYLMASCASVSLYGLVAVRQCGNRRGCVASERNRS